MIKKVSIFNFTFTCSESYDEIVSAITNFDPSQHSEYPFLITPNVDQVVNFHKAEHHILYELFKKSAFILPDGQPLVWFSKMMGNSLIQRLPGSSLFPFIWSRIKEKRERAFFILKNETICHFYENEYSLCQTYSPPFFETTDEHALQKITEECINKIKNLNPHYVFIGIEFPKQNLIALKLFENISTPRIPLFLMLGASMEFYSGHLPRSPIIFQKIGLEWLYRFLQQPKRLFKRYFINDLGIVPIFIKEVLK